MERKRNIQPAREQREADVNAAKVTAIPRAKAAPKAERHNSERQNSERRGTERKGGARPAMTPANSVAAIRLVDLSTHGCCLGFAASVDYRPGQFIRLGFSDDNEAVRAIVRWTEGARIGAEFTTGLTAERIEAILEDSRNPLVGLL